MAVSSSATVRLPAIISDGMVLQQGVPIALWGWADPGEAVSAGIGSSSGSTNADEEGRWALSLPPMDVGGPYELEVSGTANVLRVTDVLVGEVWLGSGQSNMQWPVSGAADAEQEIASADHPAIRMFTVAQKAESEPQDDVTGQWLPAAPANVGDFSAVGYYFSRQLHGELQVPVGFVHSSWGGTPAEAWTRRAAFDKPSLAPVFARQTASLQKVAVERAVFDEAFSGFTAEPEVSEKDLVGTWDTVVALGQQEFQFPMAVSMADGPPVISYNNFGAQIAAQVDISAAGIRWTYAGIWWPSQRPACPRIRIDGGHPDHAPASAVDQVEETRCRCRRAGSWLALRHRAESRICSTA